MSPRREWFYAVNKGRVPGVYTSWAHCALQVIGYSGAIYKKFATQVEAEHFVSAGQFDSGPESVGEITLDVVATSQPPSERIIVLDPGIWNIVHCEVHQTDDASVGVGVWWGEDDPRNVSERCPGAESLERGELVAVARALESAPLGTSSLLVKTTSLGCINLIKQTVQLMKAEGPAEGVMLHDMPLSIYLPQLLSRIRQQNCRIRFRHLSATPVVEDNGVQNARHLAWLGAQREGRKRRVWSLLDEPGKMAGSPQMSIASLEIEV